MTAAVHWRRVAGVVGAVLTVLLVAAYFWEQGTADLSEVAWTMMGGVGTVFAYQVTRRRWRVNAWRKAQNINGLFAIIAHGSAILRTSGLIAELLILISGLSAMAAPPAVRVDRQVNDTITSLAVIGVAACVTFSAWYADRQAQRTLEYQLAHPEDAP